MSMSKLCWLYWKMQRIKKSHTLYIISHLSYLNHSGKISTRKFNIH